MSNTSYIISYNKQIGMLQFKHELLPDGNYNMPLGLLFNRFGLNVNNIIFDSYQLRVCQVSKGDTSGTVYTNDIPCNELITDIIFLQGKYKDYKNHRSGLLSRENFELWQNATKNADKPAILKMLYQDNKISRAYLFKYAYDHPASLYELGKYSLFINSVFGKEKAVETEKIDALPLPCLIKEDIKLSFL